MTDARLTILMVEDNEGDYLITSELLSMSELSIDSLIKASRISEAIGIVNAKKIDLILLDLSLPDSYGIETFKFMRRAAPAIPIIILSGQTDMKVSLDAINLGAQDYLIKGEFDEKLLGKTILHSIERLRSHRELSQSNERYNLISMATNDMVWDWNLVTGDVFRNEEGWKKLLRDYELTSNNSRDMDWEERIHPEDRPDVIAIRTEILKSLVKDFFEIECRVLRNDGTYAYIHDRGNIIRNELGKPVRIIGATQDITERKEAEETLRLSEERYRYLFNNNPAGIIIWDIKSLVILEVNETAVQQYGYSRQQFLNRKIIELYPKEDHTTIYTHATNAREDENYQFSIVSSHLDAAGNEIYINVAAHRRLYNGKAAFLMLGTDVTEKVMLEQKLEEERMLKQQQLTDAVLSAQEQERNEIGRELHDNINQILASARLYLGLVKSEQPTPHPFVLQCDNLINTAINEIRSLSHSLIPPSLADSELLQAIHHIITTTNETTGITIQLKTDDFDEEGISDKLKLTLYRIIQEQFNNIHKYAKASNILLELIKYKNQVQLRIKDDGVGFDTTMKSSGVGLTNIRTRASLFQGSMQVNASPGNGCELIVTFDAQSVLTT